MWVYDLETLQLLDANAAALALFGYERHEVMGRTATELRAMGQIGDDDVHISGPQASLPVSVTRRYRRKDGTLIHVHIFSHPLMFEGRSAILAVAQEITALRQEGAPGQQPSPAPTIDALMALSTELQAARTDEHVYATLASYAKALTPADHVSLLLVSDDGQSLAPVHTVGTTVHWPAPTVPVAHSHIGVVITSGRALMMPRVAPCAASAYVDDAVYRSFGAVVGLPIGARGRPVGVLVIARAAGKPRPAFTTADLHLVEDIARLTSAAIERIRMTRRLQHAYAHTALALAQAIEQHGSEAGSRAARLVALAAATAGGLGCSGDEVEDVRWGARLYDIGMAAIPGDIAGKREMLTDQEWAVVRQHPVIAHEVLRSVDQLHRAAALVRHHQERWDGRGYPDGLQGPTIPIGARILAVLEAFAAMSEDRPYRPARRRREIIMELRRGAGTQFDAAVIEAFCHVLTQTSGNPSDRLADQPRTPSTRLTASTADDPLLAALRDLPDGARQLVRRLEIEDVDHEVEAHLTRVVRWSLGLAEAAGVPSARRRRLAQAAFLHDVGKLSLSRALLRKPGALSPEERTLVAQHVTRGVALLRALEVDEAIVEIVAAHHERWDGTGYPHGLAGETISLEARILAIADSFDAMTNERVYHHARTPEDAAAELRREGGRQFDAWLVDLFTATLTPRARQADPDCR